MIASMMTSREWHNRRYLISPAADFLLAGGVAFLLLPLLFLLFPVSESGEVGYDEVFYTSILFAVMAYLVNHPHFMVSYQLMYRGYREKLDAHQATPHIYWRYVIAGMLVPFLLLSYLAYCFISQDSKAFAYGVHIMFFTVGWHYVKQAFGVFVMLSALKGIFYNKTVRLLLLLNCFLVWMLSWLGGNIYVPGYEKEASDYYGVSYTMFSLNIPDYIMDMFHWLVTGYGIAALVAILLVSYKQRTRPSFTALAGYTSMYSLLLLAYYHPLWVYMTPMFHSAQYLMFVYAYKRGETSYLQDEGLGEPDKILERLKQFMLISFLLGILTFTGIPRTLEWLTGDMVRTLGLMLPFIYAFDIFINIHHYFIDNVIWRKENTQVGKYIFYSKKAAV